MIMSQLGLCQLKHYSQMNYFILLGFSKTKHCEYFSSEYIFFMEEIIKKSLMYSKVLKLAWAIFT